MGDEMKEFQINATLKITIQKGDYGLYVKVQRNNRWIAYSKSLWNLLKEKLGNLRTVGNVTYLTKAKRLEVITFENKRYVSFVEQKPDSKFKSFINFNDNEWDILLNQMERICNALVECNVCHNLKRPIVPMKNKRLGETSLTKKQVDEIKDYNATVQNQLGIRCLYCGRDMYDDCHCHAYDCESCEPQNFCPECHVIIVYDPKSI